MSITKHGVLTPSQIDTARSQLERYGYDMRTDGTILTPSGKETLARVTWNRSRFVVFSTHPTNKQKLFSGLDLGAFVERFWGARP